MEGEGDEDVVVYIRICMYKDIERERERERDVIVMRISRLILFDLDLDLSISTLGAATAFFWTKRWDLAIYTYIYMYIFDATSRYLVPDNGFHFVSGSERVRPILSICVQGSYPAFLVRI